MDKYTTLSTINKLLELLGMCQALLGTTMMPIFWALHFLYAFFGSHSVKTV